VAAIAKFRFGSATAFGTFMSCFGGGALLGMITAGTIKRPRHRGVLMLCTSALQGIGLGAIGLLHAFLPLAAVMACVGVLGGLTNIFIMAWLQARVDHALMGRVMSVVMFAAWGLMPVSFAIAGALAQVHLTMMFLAAGGTFVAVCAVAAMNRATREID
jgi:hypothetical protein